MGSLLTSSYFPRLHESLMSPQWLVLRKLKPSTASPVCKEGRAEMEPRLVRGAWHLSTCDECKMKTIVQFRGEKSEAFGDTDGFSLCEKCWFVLEQKDLVREGKAQLSCCLSFPEGPSCPMTEEWHDNAIRAGIIHTVLVE